jgi:hypothetical protein
MRAVRVAISAAVLLTVSPRLSFAQNTISMDVDLRLFDDCRINFDRSPLLLISIEDVIEGSTRKFTIQCLQDATDAAARRFTVNTGRFTFDLALVTGDWQAPAGTFAGTFKAWPYDITRDWLTGRKLQTYCDAETN